MQATTFSAIEEQLTDLSLSSNMDECSIWTKCIFCSKSTGISKSVVYRAGVRTSEATKFLDIKSEENIKRMATTKNDENFL